MKNLYAIFIFLILASCNKKNETTKEGKLQVVTTTTMLTDLLTILGDNYIEVNGLMGAGVDPHLYKASEGDVQKLFNANAIFYNGLHLEGKLEEVFEKMRTQNKTIVSVSNSLDKKDLIASADFASSYDPHIWFNIECWIKITNFAHQELVKLAPEHEAIFTENKNKYIEKLKALKTGVEQQINTLKPEQRILVTAHDAFNYFGQDFGFKVVGLQGLSTATEAGVKDVQVLAKFIFENKIKAIFVESSVPKRTIEALQAAVQSKGQKVEIGGVLYSDALGNPGTKEGTYLGMYQSNVNTIVNALK